MKLSCSESQWSRLYKFGGVQNAKNLNSGSWRWCRSQKLHSTNRRQGIGSEEFLASNKGQRVASIFRNVILSGTLHSKHLKYFNTIATDEGSRLEPWNNANGSMNSTKIICVFWSKQCTQYNLRRLDMSNETYCLSKTLAHTKNKIYEPNRQGDRSFRFWHSLVFVFLLWKVM